MQDTYQTLILPDVQLMLQEGDIAGLAAFCNVVHPAAVAEILDELQDDQIWPILDQAELPVRVEIFEYMSLRRQIGLVEQLDTAKMSELFEWMSADDRVDLLSRMPPDRREDVLRLIARAERNDIRKLLSYDEDSAGAIMTTEYASLPANISVREALDQLRLQAPNSETIYYVYIISEDRRLEGFISLRELILARPDARLASIMQRDVIRFKVSEQREVVAQEMGRYNFIAVPIVDADDRLVGIVTHDDAMDVVQEEATEDAYLQSAVAPLDDTYEDTPLLTILWKRGIWLLFLSIVALMNARVIDHYRSSTSETPPLFQHETGLATLILLFLPLVMASGGNAGSQSATLFIRMFALQPTDSKGGADGLIDRRLILREFVIGMALGVTLASLDFMVAWVFFGLSIAEAAAIATTVVVVVILGTSAGTLLPLGLRRAGMDPAIMSNPLIAAMIDILAVVIFYEIAGQYLS
ncbi:MAG: magnesium transporter [Planctomycetaceae bacterium]|nr:magnesium transporter [Planctomycetaceae bacterium]